MKAVDLTDNRNGTWTARIFYQTYTGTRDECERWIRNQGEQV